MIFFLPFNTKTEILKQLYSVILHKVNGAVVNVIWLYKVEKDDVMLNFLKQYIN